MISLAYRKAVYHCFNNSHSKSEFSEKIAGMVSVLIYDSDARDNTGMSDLFAIRDELEEYFEPKPAKAEGPEPKPVEEAK